MSLVRLEITVPPQWERIGQVREAVSACVALVCTDADRREALAMAATELTENAIKYGVAVGNVVTVALHAEDDAALVVDVSNRSGDPADERAVRDRIEWIASFASASEAFCAALERIGESTLGDASGLGLARIAYEAESTLSVSCVGDVLTVRARQAR